MQVLSAHMDDMSQILGDIMVLGFSDLLQSNTDLTYLNLLVRHIYHKYIKEKAILVTKNKTILELNNFILGMLLSQEVEHLSCNAIYKAFSQAKKWSTLITTQSSKHLHIYMIKIFYIQLNS